MPAEMVLDTSFVVEALVPSQRLHAPCQQFLRRLSEGDSTIFFNRLLEIELREAVFQIALKERHAKEWRRFRHDGRARRRADRLLSQVDKAWEAILAAIAWARIEVHEVVQLIPEMMTRYGLSSYDAVHAATASFVRVRDLATLDVAFSAVPQKLLNLHVDSSRAERCRKLRTAQRLDRRQG